MDVEFVGAKDVINPFNLINISNIYHTEETLNFAVCIIFNSICIYYMW